MLNQALHRFLVQIIPVLVLEASSCHDDQLIVIVEPLEGEGDVLVLKG